MNSFVGREKELEGLRKLLKKKAASLVVVKGRRRIGKSRLADEFARSFPKSYLLAGIPPEKGVSAADQRAEFARQMTQQRIAVTRSHDWGDLFTDLAIHCEQGRNLIILDEVTWMGGLDPTFLPKLKTIWDLFFKKNPRLVLLITGSNSAWIDINILSSTGFLGRVSHQLHLKELPLPACNAFWGDSKGRISAYEKLKVLSVTGGIPRYLEEVQPTLSAEQNITDLCYQPTGILFNEFDRIFSDLFRKRNRLYRSIVQQVVNGKFVLNTIAEGVNRSKGGDFSTYLEELVEGGFLRRDQGWNIRKGREERLGHYQVSDNYIRFYLKYVEPYRRRIESDEIITLPRSWKSIMGLQFENLVGNNQPTLLRRLGLTPDEIVWVGPFVQRASARRQGCQIDLLIQTRHRVIYLCEIKFFEKEVPYLVVREAEERFKRLDIPRGFSCRNILIHVNGVAERLEQDEFFSDIIDFGDFLEDRATTLTF